LSDSNFTHPAPAPRRAWLILAALLLFSIAAPLNQSKVPPILPILMETWGLSVGRAGLLMSLYAITGLLLALPAGFIFQRVGYRWTGLLAGGSIALGAALGALSPSVNLLLFSRAIEGLGTGFVAVMAPAVIAPWFPRHRGIALGIWATWVPVGLLTMLLAAPALADWGGWRSVWWFGCLYAALTTLLFLLLVRPAPASPAAAATPGAAAVGPTLRNPTIWWLGAAFACYCIAVFAVGTFLPTYIYTVRGVALAQAAQLTSLTSLMSILSGPAGGVISDRIGSRKRVYQFGLIAAAVILPLTGAASLSLLIVLIAAQGLFLSVTPPNIFAAAIETGRETGGSGLAMAVVMMGQNAGVLIGPLLFGALAESPAGWGLAFASLPVICLLGVAAGARARVR
jgi:MFS family permease